MKNRFLFSVILLTIIIASCAKEKNIMTLEKIKTVTGRYNHILSVSTDLTRFPRTISANGDLISTDIWDWTSGFFLPVIPRDASAAAITSYALFELESFSKSHGKEYIAAATKILKTLASPAYTESPANKYFILNHCVGSIPHGVEIDVPLVYAGYYFLEAALRYKRLE